MGLVNFATLLPVTILTYTLSCSHTLQKYTDETSDDSTSDPGRHMHPVHQTPLEDTFICGSETRHTVLYYNTKSGARICDRFQFSPEEKNVRLYKRHCLAIHSYEFSDPATDIAIDVALSLAKIKEEMSLEKATVPVYLIAIGGDGTFHGTVEHAIMKGVNTKFLVFGIFPGGTGNDAAAHFGWKNQPRNITTISKDQLKRMALQWYSNSDIKQLDVWNLTVNVEHENPDLTNEAYEPGYVSVAQNEQILRYDSHTEHPSGEYSFRALNYISIGTESLVGWNFELKRSRSVLRNKLKYGGEAIRLLVKRRIHPQMYIDNITSTRYTKHGTEEYTVMDCSPQNETNIRCPKKFSSLVFLNISRIAGGLRMWRTGQVGFLAPSDSRHWGKYVNRKLFLQAAVQDSGDKQLEVLTMGGILDWGLALAGMKNRPRRIDQGSGPYTVHFRPGVQQIYFQCDGEYYRADKPTKMSIQHWNTARVIALRQRVNHF